MLGRANYGVADAVARQHWLRTLLASTSFAAILVGSGTPSALAACPTTITGSASGCTNTATITGIAVTGATVAGSIVNSGTISPNGITIDIQSTVNGAIENTGQLNGGISNAGTISASGAATGVLINGTSTFAGGINNSGTIAADGAGIFSEKGPALLGGISNGGLIAAGQFGLRIGSATGVGAMPTATAVLNVSSFGGGVTNAGTISLTNVGNGIGIAVSGVSTFAGGITSLGTITGALTGIQVGAVVMLPVAGGGLLRAISVSTFAGGVVNSGTIAGAGAGVGIDVTGVSTFANGITNTGVISQFGTGVQVGSVSFAVGGLTVQTFSGGIANIGTISGTRVGIFVDGVSTFSGGITNAGTIAGVSTGIWSENGPVFLNGITNGGAITAAKFGIRAGGVGSAAAFRLVTRFAGGISNSGTISVGGNGIGIYVGGVSTFSGGISNTGTISAGGTGIWAAAGAGLRSENGPGGIFNGGSIVAAQAGVRVGSVAPSYTGSFRTLSSFAGGISNAGTISVTSGAGVLLSQISIFRGGITNSGTINAQTGILLGSSVSGFVGAIANTGTITGTGGTAIDLRAARNAITINQSGGLIAGAIKLSALADTINITGGAVTGDILGQGPNGTVNFSPGNGNSFNYFNAITGVSAVNVQSGTLFDNNTIGAATVTVNSGATLAPGLPGTIGSLAVTGDLAFQPGAFYLVQVGANGASSASVTGTAALAGTVLAALAPGASLSKHYDILHAAGGLGGSTFDGGLSTINMSANLSASLSYGPNDAFLDFTALGLAPNNGSINDQNVSAAIANFFNNSGTLPPGFTTLFGLSNPALLNALTQLDGEVGAGGGAQAGIHLTNSFLSLLLNGLFGDRSTLGGFGPAANAFAAEPQPPPFAASAYAALDQVAGVAPPIEARRSFWASAYGGQASASGDAVVGSSTTRTNAVGFAAGLDYRVSPDALVGFALAGANTGWNVGSGLGSGSSDAFQAGVYGTQQFGAGYLSVAAAYAWHAMNTKRTVTVSGIDTLTADFHANNIGARLEAGHRLAAPLPIAVTPYAAAQAQAFFLPASSESATSGSNQFALSYAASTATATRAELGAWFDTRGLFGDVHLFSRLAWAHDWNDDSRAVAFFQTLPGASFVVNGAAAPNDVALVTAGAGVRLGPVASVSAKFDGEFANAYRSYAGSATFRYGW